MYAMKRVSTLIVVLLLVSLLPTAASAVSISASPRSASVGQQVSITLHSSYTSIVTPCFIQINYGDGSGWINVPPACATPPCTNAITHAYTTPGTYRIQARTNPSDYDCVALLIPPTTASTTVTVSTQEIDLPDGVVGMEYEYELGDRINRYRKTTGRLDAGLKIIRNTIKGIPVKEGKYRFQISATDPRGTTINTWYNLNITKALLTVTTTPNKITLDRNRAGSFRLTYHFKSSEELNDTLSSPRGVFLAGSRRLGTINKNISTRMTKGKAQLNEQVTIPLAVIKTAQRMGIDQIRYQRTFTPKYMDAATTSSLAVTVGTGFTFTRIRITFLDKTSKKFVKRNQKIDGAQVELRYEGAGLLKGYWQVDDRILARVTKNLPFANARTITLRLPKVPPLPTHAIGSHRLRFVITNPPMQIPFPQVIYVVTGEDLATTHPIHLLSPVRGMTAAVGKLSFSWKPSHDVALYKLEIFSGTGKKQKTVFTAFSKKAGYPLPETVAKKKLVQDKKYFWRITGLDRNNRPVAQSAIEVFHTGAAPLTYVPGRLLMLVDIRPGLDIKKLLQTLTDTYPLTLIERKPLKQIGRELVTFSTTGNVEELARTIAATGQGIVVQPDYLYETLGKIPEQANREALFQYLHLQPGSTGKGIRVAIIDTGVDLVHDDLAANIISHANFIKKSPYRAEIHGTAVAGIIGARINNRGTAGIAPQSGLIALRACEQVQPDKAEGRCYSSSIIQAIDAAMAKKAEIVNMSLGTDAPDRLVASALDTATDAGIIILAPAGNDPRRQTLAFPASHAKVISVAGILDNGRKMPNSTVAAQADCILPAQYIQITLPGGRVSFMNGTSMASAEAAGLFADLHPGGKKIADCRKDDHLFACLVQNKK